MSTVHARRSRTRADVDTEALDWRSGLLAPVVRIVVEAALEAELDAHLTDGSEPRPAGSCATTPATGAAARRCGPRSAR